MKRDYAAILPPLLALGGLLFAVYLAVFRPGYLNNTYLGGLIFSQIVIAALWRYRERVFPLLMLVFLWAGTAVPLQAVWTTGRWFVLAAAALAGFVVYLRDRSHRLSSFHLIALFCVLAAVVSAVVSSYPRQAIFKAISLFLLFLYAASGARLAVADRVDRFFPGLVLVCELLTYFTAVAYFVFHLELFGNRNSLGAVMGVVVVPLMLWGILVSDGILRQRRTVAFVLALFLLLFSLARAGIVAGPLACGALCIALRRYRLLLNGLALALLLAAVTAIVAPPQSDQPGSMASVFLYKGHQEGGILGSRKTPWEQTLSVMGQHPWFGSGFGTSTTSGESAGKTRRYETSPQVTREHGSSYLAIAEWVGLLGVVPFAALLLLTLGRIGRVFAWLRRTQNPYHVAVPTAAVLMAGLTHAVFEDWLFAVGYYLCVFFWVLAFALGDLLPEREVVARTVTLLPHPLRRSYARAVANR